MKRLIGIIILVFLLAQPVNTFAEAKTSLTYERSASLMKLNNTTLKKLQRAEEEAYRQYYSNELSARNTDINGITVTIDDKEVYIPFKPETKLMMKKVKELYPEQFKFSWEASKSNHIITMNSLNQTLRGVFFGIYSSQSSLQLKQKQFNLAAEINRQDKLKLEKGMITNLDMTESDYNLEKAQKETVSAQRDYDNAVRNFIQFVGLPSSFQFTQADFEDVLRHPAWKPVDYYIGEALANRFDIVSIRRQIAMKELDKNITESGHLYQNDTVTKDEYDRLLNDIEQLNVDLEGMQLSITNEIKNAYVDVIKAGKGVDNLNNSLKLQQRNYDKMQEKFKAGFISKTMLTQAELQLIQLENGYKAAFYDYNTRIIRFNNATGIGPGY